MGYSSKVCSGKSRGGFKQIENPKELHPGSGARTIKRRRWYRKETKKPSR